MSRDGKSQVLPYLHRPRASQYASLLVAALLTLAAASNLIDVYGSAASWALAAIPATIIGSLVALAGTVPALRLWWQILFTAVAQLVVGPVLFLNDTTITHFIPTLRTLTQGWMQTLGSFKFILSVEPPTGTTDGCLLAVWTICLWFALLTGIFAVTEDGRFTTVSYTHLRSAQPHETFANPRKVKYATIQNHATQENHATIPATHQASHQTTGHLICVTTRMGSGRTHHRLAHSVHDPRMA